jgi:hypothetical protein
MDELDPIRMPRAYRCWLPGQEDLGYSYTLAINADRARYATALSAADAGFLPRDSPHLTRCRRCPEHDWNPALDEGLCSSEEHLKLGAAVAANPHKRPPPGDTT